MKTFSRTLLLCAALAAPVPTLAQAVASSADHPFLNPLFSDYMVLQRGQSDPVWGWTTPGATVRVSIAGKSASAVADADGAWMAHLPPLPTGGPYTLRVDGPQTAILANVQVGDVWVCSGQSNMEFGIGNTTNADQEIAAANYPQIRLFMVQHNVKTDPQATAPVSPWAICTPQSVKQGGWNGFSAVGYFFGRNLHENQHVPIGLIETNWGGTPAEAWTSGPALAKMPDFRAAVAQLGDHGSIASSMAQQMSAWYAKNDPGAGGKWSDPATGDAAWPTMTLPALFQDAGIPELSSFNGIIWFRKTVDLPADAVGKDVTLHFLADDNDTTWINGIQIGATEGYNIPRAYHIPAGVLKAGPNVVAIRVLDTGGKGGIYGDAAGLSLEVAGGQPVSLVGPWRYHTGVSLAKVTPLPRGPVDQNTPTTLYNGMIAPLIPFGIKGALWYQGETNAGRAYQYRTLLPTMIGDWRARWGEGNFPFYIVQLANWAPGGESWAELREAQWLTAKNVPNAGIATAIDIGDTTDIHPKNKQEVGRRLALVAEAQAGEKVEDSGPLYKAMTVDGGAIRLTFDHLGGGLTAKAGGPLTGFTLAGADRKFVPANARIDGDSIVVSSLQVTAPVAVRYAWAADPAVSLYNKAGLPALPFRTDDWPGVTVNNR
jgi:sialate O-acetylesterase